jgi:Undecaprenyl-phosphate glucose phosphotransferase
MPATLSSTQHVFRVRRADHSTLAPISIPVICGLIVPLDFIAVLSAAALSHAVWLDGSAYSQWGEYALISLIGAILAVNIFHFSGLYNFDTLTRPKLVMRRLVVGWTGVEAALIALSFFTRTSEDYSRAWSLIWFAMGLAMLLLVRWAVYRKFESWAAQGRLFRKFAVVGSGHKAARLVEHLKMRPDARVRIQGVYDDVSSGMERELRVDGDLDELIEDIRLSRVDAVIIAVPWSEETRIRHILGRLESTPVDVHLCPDPLCFTFPKPRFGDMGGVSMLQVAAKPFADWPLVVKEIEDRILASLILLMISPLLLAVAALIKLDSPGPVFFRQKRYGYNNQLIEVLKFRTMHHAMTDANAEQLTRRNDPRITRIGAYLRKWSIDELPQFINVLRGEMSIVGPRPHATSAKAAGQLYHDAVRNYVSRHRVKPGITGWAQVNGWRGETDTLLQIRKRVEHDLAYIENWSLWLDLKIIVLTVTKGLGGRNAF